MKSGIGGSSKKNELDIYLSETALEESDEGKVDLLRWWKLNSERFPILSSLARDVLVIPISTVMSESAFSTCGWVLDFFWSYLTLKLIEALIWTQDWLKKPHHRHISVEESLEKLEDFEKGTKFCNFEFMYFF